MNEFGELILTLVGIGAVVMAVRVAWIMAIPVSMALSRRFGSGNMEWHRGKAEGRPDLRYITDGWGRIVYAELDPESECGGEANEQA